MEGFNVFYEFDKVKKTIFLNKDLTGNILHELISLRENIPKELFKLNYNGKFISDNFNFDKNLNDLYLKICFMTLGGKGGFGSMLRAIGAQIEKTTNKEACRDLNGRRLRDVNAEKRIKKWYKKKSEHLKILKKRKIEKLEKMTQEPKIDFNDDDYLNEKESIPLKIDDAVDYALKKNNVFKNFEDNQPCCSSNSSEIKHNNSRINNGENINLINTFIENKYLVKRKISEPIVKAKKKKVSLWLGDDLSEDSD